MRGIREIMGKRDIKNWHKEQEEKGGKSIKKSDYSKRRRKKLRCRRMTLRVEESLGKDRTFSNVDEKGIRGPTAHQLN